MANSVAPDQHAPKEQFDLDLDFAHTHLSENLGLKLIKEISLKYFNLI